MEEQLHSLNAQTYENMEILIYDDCPEAPCDPDIFKQCLPDKKYRILPSKKENVGYTKAFEYLVQSSKGKYVAFAIRCVTGRAGRGNSGIPMTILALKIFLRLAHQACV